MLRIHGAVRVEITTKDTRQPLPPPDCYQPAQAQAEGGARNVTRDILPRLSSRSATASVRHHVRRKHEGQVGNSAFCLLQASARTAARMRSCARGSRCGRVVSRYIQEEPVTVAKRTALSPFEILVSLPGRPPFHHRLNVAHAQQNAA